MMKKEIIILAAIMAVSIANAVEIQSAGNGNWIHTATWDSGTVPTLADRVLITYNVTITIDSAGNEAGGLRLNSGKTFLNLDPGGELTLVNSGAYPTNGVLSYGLSGAPAVVNIQGGAFEIQGAFKMHGGNSGVTNALNVSSGSIDLLVFSEIGVNSGGGLALVDIAGGDASFTVGGNMKLGASSVLRMTPAADGSVTPIVSDNFKNVILQGGALVVDMTAMRTRPSEIVLIDNNGTDAIDGTFGSTNPIGTSNYELSYTGGDGNDVVLSNTNQTLSGYDAWAADYLTLTGVEQDDDDGDGLSNLEEFGLGGNPTNSAETGYDSTFEQNGESLEFVHVRRTTADNELIYILEKKDDLVDGVWTSTGAILTVGTNAMPSDPDFEAVTNPVSTSGKTQEFIRLKISTD